MKHPHPGFILKSDFMSKKRISGLSLSKEIGMSVSAVNRLIQGKASMSVEMAHKLAARFGNAPIDWLNMQNEHDIENYESEHGVSSMKSLCDAIGVDFDKLCDPLHK